MALETAIAQQHWPIDERRDRSRTYNPKTRAELKTLAPDFPWDAYFTSAGLGIDAKRHRARAFGDGAAWRTVVKTTPVSTWKEYLTWHYVRARLRRAAEGDRRREFRLLRPHAERPAATARTLEARGRSPPMARSAKRSGRSMCSVTSRRNRKRRRSSWSKTSATPITTASRRSPG